MGRGGEREHPKGRSTLPPTSLLRIHLLRDSPLLSANMKPSLLWDYSRPGRLQGVRGTGKGKTTDAKTKDEGEREEVTSLGLERLEMSQSGQRWLVNLQVRIEITQKPLLTNSLFQKCVCP